LTEALTVASCTVLAEIPGPALQLVARRADKAERLNLVLIEPGKEEGTVRLFSATAYSCVIVTAEGVCSESLRLPAAALRSAVLGRMPDADVVTFDRPDSCPDGGVRVRAFSPESTVVATLPLDRSEVPQFPQEPLLMPAGQEYLEPMTLDLGILRRALGELEGECELIQHAGTGPLRVRFQGDRYRGEVLVARISRNRQN
jgi:hypothetical protein